MLLEAYRDKNKDAKIDLSLVVPSYNESERLPVMLKATADHLKKINISYEIIIANDGSKDNTTEAALKCGEDMDLNIVVL